MSSAIYFSEIPRAECELCGGDAVGWALAQPGKRICGICGGRLIVQNQNSPKEEPTGTIKEDKDGEK